MQVWPRTMIALHVMFTVGIAAVGALAVQTMRLPWFGHGLAVGAGLAYLWLATRRYRRRRALVRDSFPERWRALLEHRVPFYRRLDGQGRERFENDLRIFLEEQHISGLRGAPVSEDVKVLIGASAAMLGHGLPDWEWPRIRDIVVYPGAFDDDYRTDGVPDLVGMVHAQGPVLLSERSLRHGFVRPHDGQNVGIHELAHVMDMADGYADGVPSGAMATAPWVRLMAERLQRLRKGRYHGPLSEYAGTDEAEFFAVAVEVFFERPVELQARDPELYRFLAEYFQQNPAGAEQTPS